MDNRLENVDRLLATIDPTEDDLGREVHFAVSSIDFSDPNTMQWAAAVLIAHAAELEAA